MTDSDNSEGSTLQSLQQKEDAITSTNSITNNSTNGHGSTWLSSNTTTDLESTNFSNASFTDITSTLLSSSTLTETDVEKSRNVTRELLLKKQLLHDVQKMKIELSQKNLLIDTLKADHMNSIDDLEDKLADAVHEKQLLQAKYESQLQMIRNDSEKQIKRLKTHLQESIKLQKKYLQQYEKIADKTADIKAAFVDIELTEDEYLDLKAKSEDTISTPDFFAVKLYENTRPLKVQIDTLHQRIELLTGELKDREEELIQERKDHEEERHVRAELDIRCQRFQVQIEDLRAQLSHRSYKNQNYDAVQTERDTLERQIIDLERTCTIYKAELEGKANQMEAIRNQMLEQNQTVALLRQDKDYLSKQLNELTPRYKLLEERFEQTCKQLDDVKHSREELYEKYLNSREHYKREYEERMKRELDELSSKTSNELNKIKESTSEMYERENRNLRDAKATAIVEQERLINSEKDTQMKYNELLGEFRQLQISSDSKVAECQNEAKLKSFELDRVQLLHEEALKNVKQMGLQNETLSKKMEALSKEYYALKGSSDRRITELEGRSQELQSKLTIYEKLEQELDDVVMQAAEMTDEGDSERVLFAYGYGANVPSTAKRRMQQSVQLARRVLQLERANTSLRHDVERETKKREQLAEELNNTTSLLNEAQQPYNYLIDSIRTRDLQNQKLKKTISTLEDDIRDTNKDNHSLRSSNNQLTADLERLLNQREEMSVLKQVVLNLKSSHADDSMKKLSMTSSAVYGPHVSERTFLHHEGTQSVPEKPLVFTNSQPPLWYKKLQHQNEMKETLRKTK